MKQTTEQKDNRLMNIIGLMGYIVMVLFIGAIMTILKRPNFKFEEFINKLTLQPTAMKDCISITAYTELIEEIYNYRRKEKVSLKY